MLRRCAASALLLLAGSCAGRTGNALPAGSPAPQARASITIRIPHAQSGGTRRPSYISANTNSLRISLATVNGSPPVPSVPDVIVPLTPSSPGCSSGSGYTTCTASVPAVIGLDAYLLKLYASTDGSGSPLGSASISGTVTLGVATNLAVVFDGIPASLAVSQSVLSTGRDGAQHVLSFTVSALDASGATIIQPGAYSTPIALSVSNDPNGALSLGATSIASPGPSGQTAVSVTYDTSKTLTKGTITLTSGAASATVSVVPIVYSPGSLRAMFAGGSSQAITVSENGYAGTFSVSGTSSYASYTCVPASCAPATAGGNVTITFAPSAAGRTTLAIGDAYGGTTSVPFGVGGSGPTTPVASTKVPAAGAYSIVSAPNGYLFIGGTSTVTYDFDPRTCTTACTVSSFAFASGHGDMLVGTDGNLYMQAGSGLGEIPLSGCPPTCSGSVPVTETSYFHMAQGDDGAFWVATGAASMEREVFGSSPSAYSFTGYSPNFVARAADGTVWFSGNSDANIGHFDPNACGTSSCTVTSYALTKATASNGITIDAIGNIWIAERYVSYVAEITCTPTCTLHEYSVTPTLSNISWIEALPDGLIYLNDLGAHEHDFLAPSSCSTTACTLAFQAAESPASASILETTVGSDGNLWGNDGGNGLFRFVLP
jgi:hypothetical protein